MRLPPVTVRAPCVGARLQQARNAIELLLRDERAHLALGHRCPRRPCRILRALGDALDDLIEHFVVGVEAGVRHADLAAVGKMPRAAPAIASSRSASGKITTGDLPPSSSVTRFRLPVAARMIDLPTSVEPVNEILSTSGCSTSAAPGLALAGDDVQRRPRGSRPRATMLAEHERGQRRLLGGLQHHRCSRRRAPGRPSRRRS